MINRRAFLKRLGAIAGGLAVFRHNASSSAIATDSPPVTSLIADASTAARLRYTTASLTPPVGRLLLVAIANAKSQLADIPTLSGCDLAWTQVATVLFDAGDTKRLTLFSAIGTPATGSLTIEFPEPQIGCVWSVVEVLNAPMTVGSVSTDAGRRITSLAHGLADITNGAYACLGLDHIVPVTPDENWQSIEQVSHRSPPLLLATQVGSSSGEARFHTSDAAIIAIALQPLVIDHGYNRILHDGEHFPTGFTVPADEVWAFDNTTASTTVTSDANIVVEGQLLMEQPDPSKIMNLRFTNVDEQAFVGGGMTVLASDVGLWVMDHGKFTATGSTKKPWTRTTGPLTVDQSTFSVEDATGWQVGDSVAITPTGPPSLDNGAFRQDVNHALTYDERTITAISGNTITVSQVLTYDHPSVSFPDWTGATRTYTAEVLNLTRNVVIEGTPTGRAHIMIMGHSHDGGTTFVAEPQHLAHIEIRYMGPRKLDPATGKTDQVVGRYGLHYHFCHDGTRGSTVIGVSMHHIGASGFVPHRSHGISFTECVAHDLNADAFWWDTTEERVNEERSADILWDTCVASKVWADASMRQGSAFRLTGFNLADGPDNVNSCIDCVAVGVRGRDSSMGSDMTNGYHWAGTVNAIWRFERCLGHNMGGSGLLVWQNNDIPHFIDDFVGYHNGKSGIDHGAYKNNYHYRRAALFANRRAGLAIHAVPRRVISTPPGTPPMTFDDIHVIGGGITRRGIETEGHRMAADEGDPTIINRPKVSGCREVSFYEPFQQTGNRSHYLITQPTFLTTPEFWFEFDIPVNTLFEVRTLNDVAENFELRRFDQSGTLVTEWNARRMNL